MSTKRFSLRRKIFVAMGIALLLPIIGVSVVAIKTQKERLITQRQILQESMLQVTMNGIMLFMNNNNPTEIHNSLNGLRHQTHIKSIRILTNGGLVRYSSNQTDVGMVIPQIAKFSYSNVKDLPNTHEIIDEKKDMMTVTRRILKEPRCIACHDDPSPYIGYLSIEGDISDIRRELSIHQRNDILVALIVITALIVVISGVHLRFVQTNIRLMNTAIKEVEQGNFKSHIPIDDSREMGSLALAFNGMIDRLNQMREELRIAHLNELQRADKLANVGELAAGMAHEIKNPVAGISGAMQVLLNDSHENSANKPIFEEILRQIRRVDNAVNSLLSYSRPRPPWMVPCRIDKVISQAMQLTDQKAKLVNIVVDVTLDPEAPEIVADVEQIQQVLVNFIMNAIQAMPNGGKLSVAQSCNLSTKLMQISVTDTGVGIEEEKLDLIFKPFFTTKHNGTGLGLAICRGIIRRHGGDIKVESIPGSGSTFTIQLPFAPEYAILTMEEINEA